MFDLFRKLLGKNEAASAVTPSPDDTDSTQDDPGKTHATAPFDGIKIKANGDIKLPVNQNGTPLVLQPPKTHSFFCREPVLNREERIAGYEFILPERVQARLRGDGAVESLQKAYDDALLHNLSSLGASALLGSRRAFVRLSPASLDNPLIAQLPVINTVLIFSPSRQMPDPSIIAPQLDALRQLGFSYGWLLRQTSLEAHPDFLALAAAAEFVQLETGGFDSIQIKSLLKSLQAARPVGLPSLQLLSSGLSSFDEFHLCFHGGFDFFLGSFVNNRENWHPPKSNVNRLHVIELLNSLRGGAEFDLIAQQIKRDPILTFKLLRYLNSPVMGLQSPVTTMDKALMVLGRERFSRWLSLFLFDIKAPGYRDRILTERALARAHFLESLAGQGTCLLYTSPSPRD